MAESRDSGRLKMRILKLLGRSLPLLTLLGSAIVFGDWPIIPDSAVPVSAFKGNQWNARIVTDGGNGSIIAWQDRRGGASDKIYLQHFNSAGNPKWNDGGIQLSPTFGYQYYPQLLPDGNGGVFITWQDNRSGVDYDIYAQHVTSYGTWLWGDGGIVVCNAAGHQYNPQIVADGSGGIIVTWQDRRSGAFDIYTQHFDANANSLWASNGLVVCNSTNDQIEPKIVVDGGGGAFITWLDYRGGSGFTDIFCQHLLATGAMKWAANGVSVCTASNVQWNAQILQDGGGKPIIIWQDRRSGNYDNIFAQKLDVNGNPEWATNGIALGATPGEQYYPQAVNDENSGAVVVWQDNRTGSDYNIVGQHISSTGQLLWSSPGMAICTAAGHQYNPQIVTQGSDFIVVWQDKRNVDFDIYAQRFRSNGTMFWATNGVSINALPKDQFMPQIVGDNVNGAIVAWADYHLSSSSTDIFAQRIGANGKVAGGAYRTINQEGYALKAIAFRDRRSPHNVIQMPNEGNIRDSIFARGAFAQGLVLGVERLDSSRVYGWEYFTRSLYTRRAFVQNGGPRPFDRIFERNFTGKLKNPAVWRYNNRLAGELLALRLNMAMSDLGLTASGFGDMIYRDTSSNVNPLNGKTLRQVAAKLDTIMTYWKTNPADYLQLYASIASINAAFVSPIDTISTSPMKLTAVKSMFSTPFLIPGVEAPLLPPHFTPVAAEGEEPESFDLSQNYPNPFNPITTIEFTLNEPSVVSLKIFNVLGQEVARLIDNSSLEGGSQILDFDGSQLSSGVYFYQLMADPLSGQGKMISQVRKMLLVK